jgi:glycosyltransferase involved in cell wall biosynthesis
MNILFLSRWFPYPPDNGSKIRIHNILRHLSAAHKVDLLSFIAVLPREEHLRVVQNYCRSIWTVPYHPFQPHEWEALLGFFSWKPRSVVSTYSRELQRMAEQAVANNSYDLVIASQIDMAPYAAALPVKVKVLEELELTVLYDAVHGERHPLKRVRRSLTWLKTTHYLARLLRFFAGCTVVSKPELERLKEILPDHPCAEIIPNGIDLRDYQGDFGQPQPNTLIYSGSVTYQANLDAVEYFIEEIYPLIRSRKPEVKFIALGNTEGVAIDHLRREGVIFAGYQEDVRPWIRGAWVSVVPLRIGGGTRLKILESLALSTPVVTTSKGAEGLDLKDGQHILVADRPGPFANAVLEVLNDIDLRHRLAEQGRQAVSRYYNWATIGERLERFLLTISAVDNIRVTC